MYTSIVVPLDGSAFGSRALPIAIALARRSDAALHLVHVHGPVVFPGNTPMWDTQLDTDVRQAMRTELADVAARLTRDTALAVDANFLDGAVVPMMQRFLADHRADLVVMTTHGRGGLSRAWLGSVADALLRHVPVPVLLLRADAGSASEPAEPLFRRILVPLDGSVVAEAALDHVVSLGVPDTTVYTLLTVIVPLQAMPPLDYPYPTYVLSDDGAEMQDRRVTALAALERAAQALRESGAIVETRIQVHYQPAQGILDVAQELHADLIALATHGRGGVERVLLGSVSDKVMRAATVAVLAYRPDHTGTSLDTRGHASDGSPHPGAAMQP